MNRMMIAALMASAANAENSNPLGKVIQLMDDLAAKITAEGAAEAKAFKEYFAWCDDAAANLHNEIKVGSNKQEELQATISEATATIAACSAKIEDISAAISSDEKELAEATAVREKEVATFKASEAELVDAIDTLDRAIGILQKEMSKNPAALAQIDTKNIDSMVKSLSAVIDAAPSHPRIRRTWWPLCSPSRALKMRSWVLLQPLFTRPTAAPSSMFLRT